MRVIHRSSRALLICIVSLAVAGAVHAQVPSASAARAATYPATQPFPELPRSSKENPDEKAIAAYITVGVANMTGGNPGAMKEARERLVNEMPPGTGNPNPFIDAYSKGIHDQIGPLLKSDDIHVRLNAAIVIARIAMKSDNTELTDLVVQMLQDPSDAVAIWGIKAATALVPRIVHNNVNTPLLDAVVDCVKKHRFPAIAQEAYTALSPGGADPTKFPTGAKIKDDIDAIQNVMDIRASRIQQGTSDEPLTEKRPIEFLTYKHVWSVQTPDQQKKSVELMARFIQLGVIKFPTATGIPEKDQYARLIATVASSLYVVSDYIPNGEGIKAAAQPLLKVNSVAKPDKVQGDVANLVAELKKNYDNITVILSPAATHPTTTASSTTIIK